MSDYKSKLALAKANVAQKSDGEVRVGFFGDEDIKRIHNTIAEMQLKINKTLKEQENKSIDAQTEQFKQLKQELQSLQGVFESGIAINNLKDIVERIEAIKFSPVINIPKQEQQKIENKIVVQDWKKEYMFSDADKSKATTYVGFVNPAGGWYIERVTKSATSDKARFTFGKSDYVSNWGKRLQLDYKYLFEVYNARN